MIMENNIYFETLYRTFFCFGLLMSIAMLLLVVELFYTAYFNPSKSATVFVDRFGEGDLEAYVVMPSIIISILFFNIVLIKNKCWFKQK